MTSRFIGASFLDRFHWLCDWSLRNCFRSHGFLLFSDKSERTCIRLCMCSYDADSESFPRVVCTCNWILCACLAYLIWVLVFHFDISFCLRVSCRWISGVGMHPLSYHFFRKRIFYTKKMSSLYKRTLPWPWQRSISNERLWKIFAAHNSHSLLFTCTCQCIATIMAEAVSSTKRMSGSKLKKRLLSEYLDRTRNTEWYYSIQ